MLSSVRRSFTLFTLFIVALGTGTAFAQTADDDPERQPISRYVVDARGVFAKYPADATIAPFLGVTADNIVKRGLGISLGGHVFPLRLGRKVTIGVGYELMFSRGSKTVTLKSEDDPTKEVDGPTVDAKLSAALPHISLNFGRRDGWSYLSGGIGWTKYSTNVKAETTTAASTPAAAATEPETTRTSTLHYGGGARWFAKPHLAFSFDIRYYVIKPQPQTTALPALARERLVMLSAGISVR